MTDSQIQHHLVSTLLRFHTLKLQKKFLTRSCRHKALSCRPLGFTIEKYLQAKPVNLPRCAAPWRRVLNPSCFESANQSPRGSSMNMRQLISRVMLLDVVSCHELSLRLAKPVSRQAGVGAKIVLLELHWVIIQHHSTMY